MQASQGRPLLAVGIGKVCGDLTHEDVCSVLVETSAPFTDEHGPHFVKLCCAQGLQLVFMVFMRSLLPSGRITDSYGTGISCHL